MSCAEFASIYSNKTCPHTNTPLVGMYRHEKRYSLYEFDEESKMLVSHICQCADKATEKDLYPLYADYCKALRDYVFFMKNGLNLKVEQYVYSNQTRGFEQVNQPEMVYNEQENAKSSTISCLNYGKPGKQIVVEKDKYTEAVMKYKSRYGKMTRIPSVPVKFLGKPPGQHQMYEGDDMSFKFKRCHNCFGEVVHVFSSGIFYTYVFNRDTGFFRRTRCKKCIESNKITELNLEPKYSEFFHDTDMFVIHCQNTVTGKMEQFSYDSISKSFYQVDHPDLVYNSNLDIEDSRVLFIASGQFDTVIMKDANGKFRKEQACEVSERFVQLPAMPVRTLEVQKTEQIARELKTTEKLALEDEREIIKRLPYHLREDSDYSESEDSETDDENFNGENPEGEEPEGEKSLEEEESEGKELDDFDDLGTDEPEPKSAETSESVENQESDAEVTESDKLNASLLAQSQSTINKVKLCSFSDGSCSDYCKTLLKQIKKNFARLEAEIDSNCRLSTSDPNESPETATLDTVSDGTRKNYVFSSVPKSTTARLPLSYQHDKYTSYGKKGTDSLSFSTKAAVKNIPKFQNKRNRINYGECTEEGISEFFRAQNINAFANSPK